MGRLDVTKPDTMGVFRILQRERFVRVAPLSIDDYRRFDAASALFHRYTHWSKTIRVVQVNETQLEVYLREVQSRTLGMNAANGDIGLILFEANRLLLNYLSAANMFIDHTKTFLKRRFGNHSSEATQYIAGTNKAYDGSFAYRFLTRLRSYALHCGVPIGLVEHTARHSSRTGSVSEELVLSFDVATLLRDYDGWSTVKAELGALRPTIRLDKQVYEYTRELEQLHVLAHDIQLPTLSNAAAAILAVLQPALSPELDAVVAQVVDDGPGFTSHRYEPPPWDAMRELNLLPGELNSAAHHKPD